MSDRSRGEEFAAYIEALSDDLLDVIEYYENRGKFDEKSRDNLVRVLHGLEPIKRFIRHADYEKDDWRGEKH